MSKCSFTINFSGLPRDVVDKAKSAIGNQGGSFNGDEASGTFHVSVLGSIEGSYTISGNEMNVEITSKPLFISCSQIQTFMQNQFSR